MDESAILSKLKEIVQQPKQQIAFDLPALDLPSIVPTTKKAIVTTTKKAIVPTTKKATTTGIALPYVHGPCAPMRDTNRFPSMKP